MVRRAIMNILLAFLPLLNFAQGHTTVSNASPRLIVGIVVENMHPDYIERYWDKFSDGGFKRIYSGGFICANHHVNNLVQRPAIGMATLSTGTTPSRHGIVSDSWMDRLKNKELDCVADISCKTVGSSSNGGERSASKLMTMTLGDRMKLITKGRSRIFSIAMNDFMQIIDCYTVLTISKIHIGNLNI